MTAKLYNTLFLCTGNSARSIMAECSLNRHGARRFRAFSAGSHPKGYVLPETLELLSRLKYSVTGLRSKGWDEFCSPQAPPLDFVFTVCDKARREVCPHWPGQPMTANWGVDDPAACEGSTEQRRKAFTRAYLELENRIKIFSSLRIEGLDRLSLQNRIDEIGKARVAFPEQELFMPLNDCLQ